MDIPWEIINIYFKENPEFLVKHHLQSYNYFFDRQLPQLFKENNPIRIRQEQDPRTKEYKYECNLYLGGIEGNKIWSYATHVATIEGDKLMQLGYWSMTTQKHINYAAAELGLNLIKN